MNISRWTPFLYLFPNRYVKYSFEIGGLDIEAWSDETYHWDQDDWNGWLDWMQYPKDTIALGHGDCEDYALVAAHWLRANGADEITFAFYFDNWFWKIPWPIGKHVTVSDGERVYSSGEIYECDLDDYLDWSEYDHDLRRSL